MSAFMDEVHKVLDELGSKIKGLVGTEVHTDVENLVGQAKEQLGEVAKTVETDLGEDARAAAADVSQVTGEAAKPAQ